MLILALFLLLFTLKALASVAVAYGGIYATIIIVLSCLVIAERL